MDYLSIGKYVNTHGLKGEIRIISDFKLKSLIFKEGKHIYLGKDKLPFVIKTYRQHKQFDMLTLENINHINDIEALKGSTVYIDKNDIDLENNLELVYDLIDYDVYLNDKLIGKVIEILEGKANDILVVGASRILIPYVESFINKIDKQNNKIIINDAKGLME